MPLLFTLPFVFMGYLLAWAFLLPRKKHKPQEPIKLPTNSTYDRWTRQHRAALRKVTDDFKHNSYR